MNGIKDFFSSIDSRIFKIEITKYFDPGHLFKASDDFYFKNWYIFLLSATLVLSLIFYRYLIRPRKRFDKEKRFMLKTFFRNYIALAIIGLIFIFFRVEGIKYLNLRFWDFLILIAILINFILLAIKWNKTIRIDKPYEESIDNYQQYLPKKNKRKK